MCTQPGQESFWSKLGWLLLDKVVFTIVVGVAVFYFQHKGELFHKKIEQSLTVAKVHTDILVEQRKALIDAMTLYFLLVESIAPTGRANEDQSMQLGNLREKVNMAVFNMSAMDPTVDDKAITLLDSIVDMNDFLLQETHEPNQIKGQSKIVRGNYRNLLDYLSISTRKIATNEFEAAYGNN